MSKRASVLAAVFGAGLVALGAGCREKTAAYCCTDTLACPALVTCPTAGQICDQAGDFGPARACIDDPMQPDGGGACSTADPCTDPGTPFCVMAQCVACEGSDDCSAAAPVCETNACIGCMTEGECNGHVAAGLPHCGPTGACVACRPAVAADCDVASAAPVCDATGFACRGCQADGECAGGLCDEGTGRCVADQDIVFVNGTTGVLGGGCGDRDEPCKDLSDGVDKAGGGTRIWVLVAAGMYIDQLSVDGKRVNIVAPGAIIQPAANGPPGLAVLNAADVSVEGLQILDANTTTGHGVSCSSAVAPAKLRLRGVTLRSNAGAGLLLSNCEADVVGSRIEGNESSGIRSSNLSSLRLRESVVIGNLAGGLLVDDGTYVIEGNVLAENGSDMSTVGGARFSSTPGAAPTRFGFNTLVGNRANPVLPGGVRCEPGFTVADSVVWMNTGTAGSIDPLCTVRYSNVGPAAAPILGEGNSAVDPLFAAVATDDYHLKATSPVINKADPAITAGGELDGQARVQGGRADMGADEAQ